MTPHAGSEQFTETVTITGETFKHSPNRCHITFDPTPECLEEYADQRMHLRYYRDGIGGIYVIARLARWSHGALCLDAGDYDGNVPNIVRRFNYLPDTLKTAVKPAPPAQ